MKTRRSCKQKFKVSKPVLNGNFKIATSKEGVLKKGMATHSNILPWRIPWTVHGVAKSQTQLSKTTTTRKVLFRCLANSEIKVH